MVILTTEIN